MDLVVQFLSFIHNTKPSDGILLIIVALIYGMFSGHGKGNYWKNQWRTEAQKNGSYKKYKRKRRK